MGIRGEERRQGKCDGKWVLDNGHTAGKGNQTNELVSHTHTPSNQEGIPGGGGHYSKTVLQTGEKERDLQAREVAWAKA